MTGVTTFRCGRFPEGEAHIRTPLGDIVTFVNGVAAVADENVAAALREVPPVFGISADEPETPAQPPAPAPDVTPAPVTEEATPDAPDAPEPKSDPATLVVKAADVRAWCKENGVDCPAKGKIPQAAQDAYLAAHANN